ncbi:nucleoside recognition domain-containing protein [Leptolyngbya sp. KIOST-1]|uniref:nucleoside recognition domain-containing protein n=1 Tax=Leptolyngbya sp. KIOST-1 TaxID=1229172 RepID=UPI000566C32C|nr:nucleoside recognition domain-containing protein [Leptolyngbya sp. KIOST-1]
MVANPKSVASPLNGIWLFLIVVATVVAAFNGTMAELTAAVFESAESAVNLAIGLIGALALWLGVIRVVEVAGLMQWIARAIRPVMVRLFPEVPAEHPAMSAMVLNMAANALGLGNAATPMGLKAMTELNRLNANPGTATHAMCLFLAINTSSVTLLPISAITVRASAGATSPGAIILPTLVATVCSTTVAIAAAKLLARGNRYSDDPLTATPPIPAASGPGDALLENDPADLADAPPEIPLEPPGRVGQLLFGGLVVAFVGAVTYRLTVQGTPALAGTEAMAAISNWLIPMLICGLLLVGYFRGVKVYEAATEGAKEGFQIAVRIIPFLVAIFVAIAMVRASGALELMTAAIGPITGLIGLPAEALPMALIRPLSGGGAFGVMSEIVNNDPDSFLAYLVSTMQGSTETTFYVMAVYFGSIGIMNTRYTLPAALVADFTGMVAALAVCYLTF